MIPNCDLSRENLSAGYSTRSDINQHVKQTLEISDLESREILISQIKGLCNELNLIFYLLHFIFSRPHSDLMRLWGGEPGERKRERRGPLLVLGKSLVEGSHRNNKNK